MEEICCHILESLTVNNNLFVKNRESIQKYIICSIPRTGQSLDVGEEKHRLSTHFYIITL